jgi:hypothetical protein
LEKEVAALLSQPEKQSNARIRVEAAIREDFTLRAFEFLELYLDTISTRADYMGKAKSMPPDMEEAICSLMYAGDRLASEILELPVIKKMLTSKFESSYTKDREGKRIRDWGAAVSDDATVGGYPVNEDLIACLSVNPPSITEKIRWLTNIAAKYNVEFDPEKAEEEMTGWKKVPPSISQPFVEQRQQQLPSQSGVVPGLPQPPQIIYVPQALPHTPTAAPTSSLPPTMPTPPVPTRPMPSPPGRKPATSSSSESGLPAGYAPLPAKDMNVSAKKHY